MSVIDKPTLYLCQLLALAGLSSNVLAQSARDEGSSFGNAIREFRLTEIVELENRINALEQELSAARNSTDTEKSDFQRRINRLEQLLSEYEESTAKRERLLDRYNLTEETLDDHLEQYQDNTELVAGLRNELRRARSELSQSQQAIQKYRASQQNHAASLEESRAAVDAIDGLLITEQQRASTLEKRLALKEQQLADAIRENDQYSQQLSELAQVRIELDNAQREIRSKSAELDILTRELETVRQQSSQAIAEAKGKEDVLRQITDETESLKSQLATKEQQIAELVLENSDSELSRKELEQLRGEFADLQRELKVTSADLEEKNRELLRVQKWNQESANVASAKNRDAELRLQQYRDEIRVLAESVSIQQSKVREAEQNNNLLQADLEESLSENKQLLDQKAAIDEELSLLREEREQQGSTITSLESDIDQLESDLEAQYLQKRKAQTQAGTSALDTETVVAESAVSTPTIGSVEVVRDVTTESAGIDGVDIAGDDSLFENSEGASSWVSLDDGSWYVEFDETGPLNYLSFDDVQNIKSQLPGESKCGEFARGFLLDESLEARLSQDGFTVNSFWVVRDNTRLAVCRLQKVANEYRGSVRRQAPSRVDLAIVPVQR